MATLIPAALLLAASPKTAAAAQLLNQFAVKMTITATCAVTTPADLDFGSRASVPANVDAATAFQVTCSNTAPFAVALGLGTTGTSLTDRKMTNSAGNTAGYQLYQDAGRTQVWGLTPGTDTLSGTGTGSAQTFNIYGRVPAQASLPIGSYTDQVTLTLTY